MTCPHGFIQGVGCPDCHAERLERLEEAKKKAKKRNDEMKRKLRETGTGWPA